jgi:hypothetical protein
MLSTLLGPSQTAMIRDLLFPLKFLKSILRCVEKPGLVLITKVVGILCVEWEVRLLKRWYAMI